MFDSVSILAGCICIIHPPMKVRPFANFHVAALRQYVLQPQNVQDTCEKWIGIH